MLQKFSSLSISNMNFYCQSSLGLKVVVIGVTGPQCTQNTLLVDWLSASSSQGVLPQDAFLPKGLLRSLPPPPTSSLNQMCQYPVVSSTSTQAAALAAYNIVNSTKSSSFHGILCLCWTPLFEVCTNCFLCA